MREKKRYSFESLLDDNALSKNQRELAKRNVENRACDPCDCDAGDDGSCRCN